MFGSGVSRRVLFMMWTCVAVFVAVVLSCFFLCLCFSVLRNGLGMSWRLLDVRGEPPPVLASLSTSIV